MDQFLGDLKAGGQMQSEGAFTLDPRRAARKLATFLIEEPGLPLYKLIQAGVASDAAAVRITLGRDAWEVALELEERHPVLLCFVNYLHNEAPSAELTADQDGLHHLIMALQFCLGVQPLDCTVWAGGTSVRFEGEKQTRGQGEPGTPPPGRFPLQGEPGLRFRALLSPPRWWHKLTRMLPVHARIHAGLLNRTPFCPIPVFLDQRAITPGPLLLPGNPNVLRNHCETWWLGSGRPCANLLRPNLGECAPANVKVGAQSLGAPRGIRTRMLDLCLCGDAGLVQHQRNCQALDGTLNLVLDDGRLQRELTDVVRVQQHAAPRAPQHALQILHWGVPSMPKMRLRALGELEPRHTFYHRPPQPDVWVSLSRDALQQRLGWERRDPLPFTWNNIDEVNLLQRSQAAPTLVSRLLARQSWGARSQLYLVLDGITCNQVECSLGNAQLIGVAADPYALVDLGQLTPVNDRHLQAIVQELRTEEVAMSRRLAQIPVPQPR